MSRKVALFLFFFFTLGLGVLHADDELLRNGDFSRGTSGWKGDRKIEQDDKGNKYMYVKADDDDPQAFYQEKIKGKDVEALVLVFSYRADKDYTGRGVTLRFSRPDGSDFEATLLLKNPGEWETVKGRFRELRRMDEFTLEFRVLPGEGGVAFDDISLKPLAVDDDSEDWTVDGD